MDDQMTDPEGRVAAVGMRNGSPRRVTVETIRSAIQLARDEAVEDGTWHVTSIEVDGQTVMETDEIWARAFWGCYHDLPREPEEWARRAAVPRGEVDRSECRRCGEVGVTPPGTRRRRQVGTSSCHCGSGGGGRAFPRWTTTCRRFLACGCWR
jgi:hypothetical protein